jgi:hypothetical protein
LRSGSIITFFGAGTAIVKKGGLYEERAGGLVEGIGFMHLHHSSAGWIVPNGESEHGKE